MALPRKTRGEYRPIYEALFDGPDYRRLSPAAKLALLTIKGKSGAMGLRVWPALTESLADMTGEKLPAMKRAVQQLEAESWIEYEDGIVWLVRGMEFEPQVSTGKKHRIWLREQRKALPNVPIVDRFCVRYAAFFAAIDDVRSDTPADTLSDTPSGGPADTTSPSPSPSPSLSRIPVQQPAASQAAADARLLTAAANSGLDEVFQYRRPLVASIGTAVQLAADLRAEGVDIEWAAATIFEKSRTLKRDEPPMSLGWFANFVRDRWRERLAREEASTYRGDHRAGDTPKTVPEIDQMREFAVRYAQAGQVEWQGYCDTRGIAWKAA